MDVNANEGGGRGGGQHGAATSLKYMAAVTVMTHVLQWRGREGRAVAARCSWRGLRRSSRKQKVNVVKTRFKLKRRREGT